MAERPKQRPEAQRVLKRPQWILLALQAAPDRGLTPVQLQKTLFLLGTRRPKDVGHDYYSFQPYHYGPFDAAVFHDADALAADGEIVIEGGSGATLRRYVLTKAGSEAATQAEDVAPKGAVSYLTSVVAWAQSLSFNELVRAIYEAYPAMREKSVFGKTGPV